MSPIPGPLGHSYSPLIVEDGTTCQVPSPLPGPECTTHDTSLSAYARRAGNVKDAFLLGVTKYAFAETVAKLGDDMKQFIESLWPGFVQMLQIYAASIGAGAALGGILGSFAGGVGAAPGAVAGAQLGAGVATAILFFLGLKFLAEYVLANLSKANEHFTNGITMAWEACGEYPNLEAAAREFGKAIAEIFSLVFQAAAAWLIKKGLKKGAADLEKSKMGRALLPYAKVEYWRNKLGVTDAPIPRKGIATTIEFFENQMKHKKLDAMDEATLTGYWKAMDFSRQVAVETLKAGKELVAYRDPKSPYGYYFSEVGTYLDRLGISPKSAGNIDREFIRYRVKKPVEALKSVSSGVRDHNFDVPVSGGGTQYFIPKSWEVLEIIPSKK